MNPLMNAYSHILLLENAFSGYSYYVWECN